MLNPFIYALTSLLHTRVIYPLRSYAYLKAEQRHRVNRKDHRPRKERDMMTKTIWWNTGKRWFSTCPRDQPKVGIFRRTIKRQLCLDIFWEDKQYNSIFTIMLTKGLLLFSTLYAASSGFTPHSLTELKDPFSNLSNVLDVVPVFKLPYT